MPRDLANEGDRTKANLSPKQNDEPGIPHVSSAPIFQRFLNFFHFSAPSNPPARRRSEPAISLHHPQLQAHNPAANDSRHITFFPTPHQNIVTAWWQAHSPCPNRRRSDAATIAGTEHHHSSWPGAFLHALTHRRPSSPNLNIRPVSAPNRLTARPASPEITIPPETQHAHEHHDAPFWPSAPAHPNPHRGLTLGSLEAFRQDSNARIDVLEAGLAAAAAEDILPGNSPTWRRYGWEPSRTFYGRESDSGQESESATSDDEKSWEGWEGSGSPWRPPMDLEKPWEDYGDHYGGGADEEEDKEGGELNEEALGWGIRGGAGPPESEDEYETQSRSVKYAKSRHKHKTDPRILSGSTLVEPRLRGGAGSASSSSRSSSSASTHNKQKIPGLLWWLAGGRPSKRPTVDQFNQLYRQEQRKDDPDRPIRVVDRERPVPAHLWYFTGGRGPPPTVEEWNKYYRQSPKKGRGAEPGRLGELMGAGDWGLSEEDKQIRKQEGFRKKVARLL